MLQDARDELEKMRNDPDRGSRRSRKVESREFKKPRLGQLGGPRPTKTELVEDEWEDQETYSPAVSSPAQSTVRRKVPPIIESSSDQFETANETSDAAFETAHERGTETEDFQTGAEELSDDDGATETEASPSKGYGRLKRPPILPMNEASSHYSFDSTASTSDDELDDYGYDLRTPTAVPSQKMRLRVSRGALGRRSRQPSEEPNLQSSPASFAGGTPQQPAQSLFAELENFEGSDDDSYVGAATPSRRSIRSVTPGSFARRASPPPEVPALPKVIMVDSGMMTEPVQISPAATVIGTRTDDSDQDAPPEGVVFHERPMSMESVIGPRQSHASTQWLRDEFRDDFSRPLSTLSYSDASVQNDGDLDAKLAQFPSPPTSPPRLGMVPTPILRPPESLGISYIQAQQIEPAEPPSSPPSLAMSSILTEDTEPLPEPEVPAPTLSIPALVSEVVEPESEPEPAPVQCSMSSLLVEQVEPCAEPEPTLPAPPTLSTSLLVSQQIEPVNEPERSPVTLSVAPLQTEHVQPVELPDISPILDLALEAKPTLPAPPTLALSSIVSEDVEPQSEPASSPVRLSFAPINAAELEPLQEPSPPAVKLGLSSIETQQVEPKEAPSSPAPSLRLSVIHSQEIEPVRPKTPKVTLPPLAIAAIQTWDSRPVEPVMDAPVPVLPQLAFSTIQSIDSEPVAEEPVAVAPPLSLTAIQSLDSEPVSPRSPKRNGFIIPRDTDHVEQDQPHTPPNVVPEPKLWTTSDQSAQTALTSAALDEMLKAKLQSFEPPALVRSGSTGSVGTPSTVRVHRPKQASIDSTRRIKTKPGDINGDVDARRPGSAASTRSSLRDLPPLPANHKEAIEAARTSSSNGGPGTIGTMGPPMLPASALKSQNPPFRPRTPIAAKRPMSPASVASGRGTPTPRVARAGSVQGTSDIHSPTRLTHHSRKSSVSSFVSEIDSRFNMQQEGSFDANGFGPNTDPRMIQAITQTMIGEYLWKYTRKAGREEMSGNRHRRYFWVHPYTRTLYWSDRDPSVAGRSELKAKSVPIEAVRVVTDDNPMPPGLHRKSLVIISPNRTIKFTCTTGQRHETWFNALSYLLLRTNNEGQSDAEEMAGNLTREDVDEFNPTYGRRIPNGTRAVPSLSSYNSRTIRNESPAIDVSMNFPTLTPTNRSSHSRPSVSTLGRISGYWKDSKVLSGTFGSLRSRSVSGRDLSQSIYEANEVQDSAEDLRQIIEQQDREADRLENVRACCDGKVIHWRKSSWLTLHRQA